MEKSTSVAVLLACSVAACVATAAPPEPVDTTASALGIAGLFSTGVDATGTPLANGTVDPHYVLSSNDAAFPGPNALAVNPAGGWTGNTATSKWISIQASTTGTGGDAYTYTTTFTLAGVDPTTATLSGKWACDDSCVLQLNGTQVAQDPTPAWGAVANFAVPAGSNFQLGTNTLAFVTTNTTGGPTGLQVVTLTGNVSGCTADNQCSAAQFCNTQAATCTPKLPNGTAVPTVTGHTPPLTGVCTAPAGVAVCISAVCDTKDNLCGYANGDGPCTAVNGGTVCRSGACSTNGTCEPAGGCNVDADCSGGNWCDESTHVCTAPFANGIAIPTDAPHTNPTLNGTCTVAAGALVCVSKVCDTKDNLCGYANGDGPCTAGTGGTVCRSGTCSTGGTCEPPGGCNVDGDCTGGNWCDESTHTCTPPLANGTAIPTDPPHTSPTLSGTCTAAAGTLVCVSKVCDTKDNECGYANGDGPCTATTGGTVCRSGACSVNGTCEPPGGCNVNGDCTDPSKPDCNPSTHTCVPAPAPDAGADGGTDGGGNDGGATSDGGGGSDGGKPPSDAGGDTGATGDSGAGHDAATTGDGGREVAQDGFVEGGGISCALASPASAPGMAGGALLGLGIAFAARRRRR